MGQVSLSVNGAVFRMACEDGEEDHVLQLGARFDAAIDELRDAVGPIGDQRLLVMAGILMTDRLDHAERRLQGAEDRLEQAERRLEGTERELQALRDSRQEASSRSEGVEKRFVERLEAAAERIERLVRRLHSPSKPGAARAADPPC
jgi:cell division protein ZapA